MAARVLVTIAHRALARVTDAHRAYAFDIQQGVF
jgi:hypothetical protein